MNEDVKRALTIAFLALTACGLGPDAAACRVQQQELGQMEADLDAAAAQREDLAPYVAAIEKARAAAEAAGC
jgi:hypothetical protein